LPYSRQRLASALATSSEHLGWEKFEEAHSQGMQLDLDAAVAYANRARGERSRPSVGWDSLTPTEARVAALIAQGLSNREIAAELFVSPETVKTHLTHMFDKLGIRSRAAIAALAASKS
jgi:DNA-binding CsgD family transcriptional regulator